VLADDAAEARREVGIARAQGFTWDASVEGIVALYRRALAER
jgi:hypothetical protein